MKQMVGVRYRHVANIVSAGDIDQLDGADVICVDACHHAYVHVRSNGASNLHMVTNEPSTELMDEFHKPLRSIVDLLPPMTRVSSIGRRRFGARAY